MHFFVKVVVVAAFLHCVVSQDRQIIIFDDEGNSKFGFRGSLKIQNVY